MKQFVLHLLRAAQVLLAAAVVCAAQYARADTFTDDFNRSDSSIVGNGWLNSPGNVGGNMLITGNKVGVPTNSGAGTLYRPFNSTSFPIHVQTKLYQGHGFAGVTSRFNHFIQIRNDGGYLRGYGLNVVRSDINSSNSQVIRVDTSGASGGAAQVDFQNSTFQFSANLDLDATYYADGSIIGTLKDAVNTFAFTFPAHAIVASGSYFALSSEYTGDTLNTRFDDVILNGQGSASDPLAPGNSGWWKFYVPSSNGTFPDLSGNGNTASMTGGSAGKIGQRTTLTSTATGINISVPASASLDPASGYTFSSLVYLPSTGMGYSSTAYSLSYADGAYPDKVLVSTYKAGTQYSSFSLIMNNLIEGWHHIVTTYDNAGYPHAHKVYVDGVFIFDDPGRGPLSESQKPISFSLPAGSGVRELRVWNRGLTAAEVQQAFQATRVGSITGVVSAASWLPLGTIRVTRSSGTQIFTQGISAPGAYFLDAVPFGNHTLTAYWDVNGNGQLDTDEAQVVYQPSPTDVESDMENINLDIPPLPDTDNDGMPDAWERLYGLTVGVNDALLDKDGDGINNVAEYRLGLRPDRPDTNGDGIGDYQRIFVYGLTGALLDSDGDGMPDAWEIAHGLNPRLNDANDDADLDGLTNLEEYLAGTDPQRRDSLGDGVSDYERVKGKRQTVNTFDRNNRLLSTQYSMGTVLVYTYDGNGNMIRQIVLSAPDADHDGLPDAWELAYGLNPNSATGDDGPYGDPDHDGWTNYQEWKAGTNPRDANSHPDLLTTPAAQLRQTPTLARLLPTTTTLGALPTLNLKLWDGEGNSAKVALQYFDTISGQWKDATLTRLDGGIYNAATAVTALPGGTMHTLLWYAYYDLGSSFNGNALLRVRADDFASTGAWSDPASVAVNMNFDSNGDGVPDRWAMLYNLDPNGPSAALTDSDGDGMNDFLEFALGLNPRLNSSAAAPVMTIEGGYLTLTAARNPAASALQFRIAVTGDLTTWFSDPAHVTILEDTPMLLKARDNVPFGTEPQRFIRLEVTKP